MDITPFLVRNSLGLIDIDSSMVKIREALETKAKQDKIRTLKIAASLCDVFDEAEPGKRLPMPILTSMVVGKVQPPAYQYQETILEIENFIRSSSDVYNISRGRNGGVMRLIRQ